MAGARVVQWQVERKASAAVDNGSAAEATLLPRDFNSTATGDQGIDTMMIVCSEQYIAQLPTFPTIMCTPSCGHDLFPTDDLVTLR